MLVNLSDRRRKDTHRMKRISPNQPENPQPYTRTPRLLPEEAVKSPRENCEHKARCGRTGHLWADGRWQRCPCLELELAQPRLRELYTPKPDYHTPLKAKLDNDILIQGPLQTVRKHTAGALMPLQGRYVVIDAYRLVEISLEKDEEFETNRPVIEADLLALLLGFGDPRNRYLPELVIQVLSRRNLMRRPTWVVCGIDKAQIPHKYTPELAAVLDRFETVNAV